LEDEGLEGTGEFPSWYSYVLWLPEEGLRYVVGPQRRRVNTAAGEDDELPPAAEPVAGRDREKVGIWMPRGLRQRLRIHAAVLDREISDLISEAVSEYLDRHDQQRAKEGLPPIPMR
jgi:hypothetical protein